VLGLTIGSAASVGWEERPVERERVGVTRGDGLVWLGWLFVK
jgi:hypothetical protein